MIGEAYRKAGHLKTGQYGFLSLLIEKFDNIELCLLFDIFFAPLKKYAWEPNYVSMTSWSLLETKDIYSKKFINDKFLIKLSQLAPTVRWNITTLNLSGCSQSK